MTVTRRSPEHTPPAPGRRARGAAPLARADRGPVRASVRSTCVAGLAAAAGAVVAGCGGASTSIGASADEAGRSADQIFADSLAAMRQVDHVRVAASQTDASGTVHAVVIATRTAAQTRITTADGTDVVVLVVSGKTFAGPAGGPFAVLAGDQAVAARAATLTTSIDCAAREHGTLSKGPVSTVNGVRVIAILDDGRYPGDAPNTTFVALDGAPRVVRATTTGPVTAGGALACGHLPNDTTTAANGDYDYSGATPQITAPPVTGGGTPPGGGPFI